MMRQTTMPAYLHPLMHAPSVRLPYCAICGRPAPLNQHHIIYRSSGVLYENGKKVEKPMITLCGVGNNLHGSHGERFCHGMAHHGLLHFDMRSGQLCYMISDEPMAHFEAMRLDGFHPVYAECDLAQGERL